MGRYFRWGRPEKVSISKALEEAVEDHYIGSPSAPYPVRTAAAIADFLLLAILLSNLHRLLAAGAVFLGSLASPESEPVWFLSLLLATDFTAAYVYFIWTTYEYGGSPAKLILHLRVVDARTGQRLELGPLFLREWVGKPLSIALLGIGFFLPLIRKDGRSLHDLMCGSVVKKVDENESESENFHP